MKLFKLIFVLLIFTSLIGCGSEDSNDEEQAVELSLSSVSEFSANAESKSLTVSANLYWFTENNNDWITLTPTNGTNNGTINIAVSTNPTEAKRTGIISVLGGDISRDLTITQAGKEPNTGGLDAKNG